MRRHAVIVVAGVVAIVGALGAATVGLRTSATRPSLSRGRHPAPGATGTLSCRLGSLPVGNRSTDIGVKVVAPGSTSATNTATVRMAVFGRR